MAQIPFQTVGQFLQRQAAAAQAACRTLLDFTPGSVVRAILEANAGVASFFQFVAALILRTTRLASSQGADVDSWLADFGLARLPASAASGLVAFSRLLTTGAALVPAGAQVKTLDGSQTFLVATDATNPAWSAAQNGYALAPGVASVTCPVVAVLPGAAGNVVAGAVALAGSAIAGIDTVSNPAGMAGGADAESDAAVRARFVAFIGSLSKATVAAIGYAVSTVQQGLAFVVTSASPGTFLVTVDDGSGAPPAALLSSVYAAVDAVRPIGSSFAVQPPGVVAVAVNLTLTAAPGYSKANLLGPVAAAVLAYVNSLPIGATLPFSRIAQVAYDAAAGIANVSAVSLNGGTADAAPGSTQVVRTNALLVTVG